MSEFCDFVPEDPSCQTTPEPEPEVPDGGVTPDEAGIDGDDMNGGDADMKDEKIWDGKKDDGEMTWEKFDEAASEYFNPMEANLAYLGVAVGAVVELVLHGFVWKDSDIATLSQAASGSGNTDYYDLLHMIETYGGLGVFGIASVTQLLATFGIMTGINMMVWGTVVPMGGMLIELVYGVIGFLAYNQFFEQYEASNSSAYTFMAMMEREMAMHTASHVAGAFEIYHAMPSWLWGAYMAADEEEKAMWREDKKFLMMLKLTPEDVKDWGMDGEKMEKMDDMDDMDDKMDDKKLMSRLMVGPPSLYKVFKF